jgi:cell division septum initiation protein DivIVA
MLDKLETNIRRSKFLGLSMVKTKEALSIINKIRQILSESFTSFEEVNKLRKQLEEKELELNNLKNNLVDNEEVVKLAYQKAQEIEKYAKEEAEAIINEAEGYAIKVVSQFEEELKKLLTAVQNSKRNLEIEKQDREAKAAKNLQSLNSSKFGESQELKRVNIKINK